MSEPARQISRSGRMAFLDYLRIFAFASVVMGHKFYAHALALVNDATIHATPRLIVQMLLPFFEFGGAGVVVFFIVSGYIITSVLENEKTLDFIVKRIFRIYPLYLVAALLNMLLSGVTLGLGELVGRLLLIGDFFNTSYALTGVDWTLRVEIVFYVLLGSLKIVGILNERRMWLPWILIAVTLLLGLFPPIPSSADLFKGSFSIYTPFLYLGVFFCLRERKQISLGFLLVFTGLVLLHYYRLIAAYEPVVLETHFATLGLLIFTVAWNVRRHLRATPVILFLSDLTFSVYLFHGWIWEPIRRLLRAGSVAILHPDIQALIVVLLLCTLMSRCIEKPGIRLGNALLARLHAHRNIVKPDKGSGSF